MIAALRGRVKTNVTTCHCAVIRRPGGSLAKETFVPGDVPADYEIDDLHGITEIIRRNRV